MSPYDRARNECTNTLLCLVFLRVLEYYNGLLFLTTNRAGALDEAFKSRIHLKLYYPPLDFEQTRDIWQMNIERLHKIEEQRCEGMDEQPLQIHEKEILDFAIKQFYQDEGKGRWNGRQIRNSFQIASSLAYFDARKRHSQLRERQSDTVLQPKLDVEHFQMIHRITDDFDQYMQETVGNSDAALAFERDDRADHWNPRQVGPEKFHYPVFNSQSHVTGQSGPVWSHGNPRERATSYGGWSPSSHVGGLGPEDGMGDHTSKAQYPLSSSYGGGPPIDNADTQSRSFYFHDARLSPHGLNLDSGLQGAQSTHKLSGGYNNASRNKM